MMAVTPYQFNSNELWTLGIAAYAAVVSTFVLGWDAYKWLASGARVEMTASTGMKQIGGVVPDQKTYISITAYNVGDQPTTITNLGGMHFETWWRAFINRRKPSLAFVVSQPSQAQRIPYRFDVGDQWIGLLEQTDELVEKASKGYLFLILYTSRGGRGHRVRIRVREDVRLPGSGR
jgi:hypothetical protein